MCCVVVFQLYNLSAMVRNLVKKKSSCILTDDSEDYQIPQKTEVVPLSSM